MDAAQRRKNGKEGRQRLLFVCTGNICRSPSAEGVMRDMLRRHGLETVDVASAGLIDYHAGDAPDCRAIERARRRGYDLSGQIARQITAEDFEIFDLVLAMDDSHYRQLRRRAGPERRHKIHRFMAFTSLAGQEAHPGQKACAASEVPDPYYGGVADFDFALDLIECAAAGLLNYLRDEEAGLPPSS